MPAPARASAARTRSPRIRSARSSSSSSTGSERRTASAIMDEIRAKTKDIPGVVIEVTKPQAGPPTGKPITLQIASVDPERLFPAARKVAEIVRANPRHARRRRRPAAARHRLADSRSTRPRPPSTAPARRTVGTAVQLVTNGVKVTEYRPTTTDKSVDILVRFPPERRSLDELDELRDQHLRRHGADRQLRHAQRRRRRSASSTASPDRGSSPSPPTSPRACSRRPSSRRSWQALAKADLGPGDHLQDEGRGRGARPRPAPS